MTKYNPDSNLSSTVAENEQVVVQEKLKDFFNTLQDTDLKVLEKHNFANYEILRDNISAIDILIGRDLDKESLDKLKRLVVESQQILSIAIRELLPFLLLSFKDKVVEEQQQISKQQDLLVQVREQMLYFAEKFELYDSDRLELYAPDLWKEIREELDVVESMLCDIDANKLPILDKAVGDLLEKLEKANDVSQKKQQQVIKHLQITKDNLDRFIETASSIDYPSLLVYKREKTDALYEDFNAVSESFFFNESSSALDYRVANARIDDTLQMLSVSMPVWKDAIANKQKEMRKQEEKLQQKSKEEKEFSERTIKFLRNKRFLAICTCLPFLFVTALLLSTKPLFEDVFFLESPLEHIATFHGVSVYFTSVCFGILLSLGVVLFFCIKKLSLGTYSIKNVQQHLLFEQVPQKSYYFLILLFLSLCIAFVWSAAFWGQKRFGDLRLSNINSFTHRGFDDHYIDIIENYTNHPEQQVCEMSAQTLFSIYKEYRDHPQISNYNSEYKTNLIAQRKWQKLSQILPAKKFAMLFAKDARQTEIISTFGIDILQELIVIAPREKSFLALEQLIVLQPKKKQYWQMIFSFYHVENKKLAIEYLAKHGVENWIEKILELAKKSTNISTYKVLMKSLVILAKRHKQQQVVADYFTKISKEQHKFSEIALYGLARLEYPSSVKYLRSRLLHTKSKKVQMQIINALAKMNDKKSIADLIVVLCEEKSYPFRKEIALTLQVLDRSNFKLWKKLAQVKSFVSRVKLLSSYSARYKLIASTKALAKLQVKSKSAQKALSIILQHQRRQTKIALMHVFSGKELEMKNLLQKLGYKNITLVHNIEAIPQVNVVIAAEKNALSEERIVELLAKKMKVLLLHNSGEVLSGVWQQQNSQKHREINLEPGFLGNIKQQLLMQQQQNTFFVTSPYPINWKPYAGNHKGYTILNYGNENHGIIFTYNPLYLTVEGRKVFTTVIDFLLEIERFELQFFTE
ncbi:HEAT repeat domain-containing protein [Candidatus Uabimicrobium sp. HlEnr_7]|uniref:HEAT repeat domain-containing protein n=1 Tax=Candidatus Uabimicrobium helgolandensis TaxID=3095367 RepID=UPI003558C0C4